ncbi:MAG: hypothetical protein K2M55_01305 [Muribaculaceae bacterium]|nr:hypothetical protein [Muribaculaceae bacterium]
MKKIVTSLLLAAATLGAWAVDGEFVTELTTQTMFNQSTKYSAIEGQQSAWTFSSYSGLYMYKYGQYSYDDYLITPVLPLEAGNAYTMTLLPGCYMSSSVNLSTLEMYVGTGDDVSTYKKIGTYSSLPMTYDADSREATFVIDQPGEYRVAFRGYGKDVQVKDVKIYNLGASMVPQTPKDFTLTPDADGNKEVTVTFTMPSTTETGLALDSTTYSLYRGGTKLKDKVAAAPGSKVTVVDNNIPESGVTVYYLEIACGDEVSKRISASTYVGIDDATAPANVKVEYVDGKYVVTWDAPTTGVNGTTLDPAKVTYTISRYVDDEERYLTGDLKGVTTYTDEYASDDLHQLKYGVTARYSTRKKESAVTFSDAITIGSIHLPFTDSFADATMDSRWENYVVDYLPLTPPQQMYFWQPRDKGSINRGTATYDPYDEDGGLLFFNFFDVQRGNSTRLATPPVSYAAGDSPVLTFARFQAKTSGKDKLKVQICTNYGEWIDIPEAEYQSGGAAEDGWHLEVLDLAELIPAGTSVYQVGFLAVSDYGINMFIDAIRLFNAIEKDLCVDKFNVTETATAGKNLEFAIKIANNGSSDVAADAYTVELDHNFTQEIVLPELEAIPSMGSVTYNLTVPVNALHIMDATDFEFTARVKFDGDMDATNNASAPVAVGTAFSRGLSSEILSGVLNEDGTYTITWEPAKDLDYTPVNISESFEDEDFENKAFGPFNGWVTIDIDGREGSTYYSASGSQFNVSNNTSAPAGRDGGKILGVTVANNVQQDDWIVSPMISCKEGSVMDLDFLFGVSSRTSSGNDYKVEILYTTEDNYNVLDPAESFTALHATGTYTYSYSGGEVPQDNALHRVSFKDIPAEAKYVAMHFCAKGSYNVAMWVDDIHLVERDEMALMGYNVYSVDFARRLNDELVGADETQFTFADPAVEAATFSNHAYVAVAPVYPDGEARPANLYDYLGKPTGVEAVTVDDAEAAAEYFNLQGVKVSGNLTPGIYIMRTNTTARKVMIK